MADDNQQPQSPFSSEQVDSIRQLVSGIVNSAIASRDKMSDKKRAEDRQAIESSFSKMLDEKLSGFKPREAEPEDKPGGKSRRSKEEDMEFAQMRRAQEELRQSLEAEKARAAKELSRNIANTERSTVFDALAEHGLDAVRAKAAYALFKLEGRLDSTVDEDADRIETLFRDDDGTQIPLRDGIKRWVKSDSAKVYLPPSGTKGSGSRPTRGPMRGPNGEQLSDDQRQEVIRGNLGRALADALD